MTTKNYNKTLNEIILKIATQFINIPFEQFSTKVQESIELIGSFLDVDRAYVFEYDFERNIADNTYEWCHEGVEPQIDYLRDYPIGDMLDDWVILHKMGKEVIYQDINLLDHNSFTYQTLAPQGILSICTIPLMIQGQCYGFVGFDDIRQKRKWTQIELDLLRVLAELIVNAIYKHKNDQLLIELREKAQKASETKGQFLAQMSHEIRTPLNGIYNAFYLMKNSNYTKEQAKFLEIAKTSLNVLSSIINNILDFSKIEAGKMEVDQKPCDLESEIVKTVKTLRPSLLKKGLACYFEFDYNIDYEVVCDLNKLNQILLNLVGNAIKYTDEGFVKTSVTTINKDSREYLVLTIEDSGSGISSEDQNKLFEAFYQAKKRGQVQGTGLGLPIVNELIHLMNGDIHIESTLGKGTHFQVMIPLVKGEQLSFRQPKNQRVLLLSDDFTHQAYYQNMLESIFHQVDDLESSSGEYDVICLDELVLKNKDIESLVEKFRNENTIVLFFSKSSFNYKGADYTFDVPISRKAILQKVLNHDGHEIESGLDKELFEGNILIVDDNEINREALNEILTQKGFTCTSAANGMEAIEKVRQHMFDMIMMDIQMPEMDGYETSRAIRDITPHKRIPIIVVTANAFLSDYDVQNAPLIDDVVFKPLNMDLLSKVIKKHLVVTNFIQIPQDMMIFNQRIFDQMFDQSTTSGLKMIKRFIADYDKDFDELKQMVQAKEKDLIYKKLHYMKGPLSYIGAEQMIYLINELMNKILSNHTMTESELKQFFTLGKQTIEELNVFVQKYV